MVSSYMSAEDYSHHSQGSLPGTEEVKTPTATSNHANPNISSSSSSSSHPAASSVNTQDSSTPSVTPVAKLQVNPGTTTSNTASHRHQQEQELLSNFAIPNPPVSTQQSSIAADSDISGPRRPHDAPRTLWMGDLDPWLDENGIADLWWQIIQKKVTVKIIQPKTSRPDATYQGLSHSGYCFVEFETFDDAQKALSLNGQLLPDIAMPSQQQFPNNPDNQKKYFRLNWASGATLSAPIIQTPEYSLFVGDLSASTTEAHLLAFFQKHFPTSIKTVRVMTDPVSGKSRCFGFVRFTDEMERQRALFEMNGVWFGGRALRVALATPRNNTRNKFQSNPENIHETNPNQPDMIYSQQLGQHMLQSPPQGPGQLGSPYYGTMGAPRIQPRNPNDYSNEMGHGQSNLPLNQGTQIRPGQGPGAQGQGHMFADPNNTTVFVGGLSSEVSEPTLYTLFKPFGNIQQIKIPPGKNCGFIKYSTREEAEESIAAMQGFIIGGNRVRLSWGKVSMNNKKFYQQKQVAQAAQLQAAAAMSMGLDPASAIHAAAAAAAAGYHHPMTGAPQMGGIPPPMGMPGAPTYPGGVNHHQSPRFQAEDYDTSHGSERSSSFDASASLENGKNNPTPQYYMPMPPGSEYNLGPGGIPGQQDELMSAMNNLNLGQGDHNENSEQYINSGYMYQPPMNYPMHDMQFQQYISQHPRHQPPVHAHFAVNVPRNDQQSQSPHQQDTPEFQAYKSSIDVNQSDQKESDS